MRTYEEMFIVRPDAPEEEIDAYVAQLDGIIKAAGGEMLKVDKWGVRRLAYRVQKHDEGFYVLLQFTAKPETIKELERRLKVADLVIKYITVRIDLKLKWLEKRKKQREKRAARRPAPQVAAPSMPAEPQVAAPAAPAAHAVPGAPVAEASE